MRISTTQLVSAVLVCGLRGGALCAQTQSAQAGRLTAAAAAVMHEMEPELGQSRSPTTQVPWRMTISSPDSADWTVVFDRLRTMLHARAPVASDRFIHYLEIAETRITDTASVFDITIGITYPCERETGHWTGSDASTGVRVSRSGTDWAWRPDGPTIIADPAVC